MALGLALTVGLLGLDGHLVEVRADIATGPGSFMIVGLPDVSVTEARDRVRAATSNGGCPLPARGLRVTLSPAALPKSGTSFDLAVAAAVLAASGEVDPQSVSGRVHLGELGLDGSVRRVPGVLPAVLSAVAAGRRRFVVPVANVTEARLVPDAEVVGIRWLRDLVELHRGATPPEWIDETDADRGDADRGDADRGDADRGDADRGDADRGDADRGDADRGDADRGDADRDDADLSPGRTGLPRSIAGRGPVDRPDLADVNGQAEAREALEVAAAGGHHLLLLGPPGAGKTTLASRLPGLLPDLSEPEALEVTAVHSVAGTLDPRRGLVRRPPFETPHHTATVAALVGGGGGLPRPGAASRAHRGVLFLDDAAEFAPTALDALRHPLDHGELVIHQVLGTVRYPARFQLVLASKPCPCGRSSGTGEHCSCSAQARRRYLARLGGPLLDRVDLQVEVPAVSRSELAVSSRAESSSTAAARVLAARGAQRRRLVGTPWTCNGEVAGPWLRGGLRLAPSITRDLDHARDLGLLSIQGHDRVLRVAWTLADLAGRNVPTRDDVGRALTLGHRGSTG